MEDYVHVREDLEKKEVAVDIQELSMVPQNYVALEETALPQVLGLLEALEDLDDVQNVWANFDADEKVMARLADPRP